MDQFVARVTEQLRGLPSSRNRRGQIRRCGREVSRLLPQGDSKHNVLSIKAYFFPEVQCEASSTKNLQRLTLLSFRFPSSAARANDVPGSDLPTRYQRWNRRNHGFETIRYTGKHLHVQQQPSHFRHGDSSISL